MSRPSKPAESDFLSRWSRRKRASVEAPDEPVETPPAAPETETEDTRSEAEILEELGLPDPDDLQPGDDIRGFMAKAVPERLRNRALRKLWISNPLLANLDELVDYGEDFTDAATVVENLQTVYRVGKGMLPDPVEEEEDAEQQTAGAPPQTAEEAPPQTADPVAEDPQPDPEAETIATLEGAAPEISTGITQDYVPVAETLPERPRRMQFQFETDE
ncbi:MAG: DUF3306 domain-containing protein [Pseudomonadota bacterium]